MRSVVNMDSGSPELLAKYCHLLLDKGGSREKQLLAAVSTMSPSSTTPTMSVGDALSAPLLDDGLDGTPMSDGAARENE